MGLPAPPGLGCKDKREIVAKRDPLALSPLWLCLVMLPEICVVDGVTHFTRRREVAIWQGMLDYLLQRGQVSQKCQGEPPVETQGSRRTSLHSKLLSQGSLCAAVSRHRHRLGQWFMSEGLYVPNQFFVSVS